MSEVYLNGAFVPLDAAKVSVMDRGFLFGDGVYEVVPVYEGHPRRLGAHLPRLSRSLAAIGLANPLTEAQWREVLVGANGFVGQNESTLHFGLGAPTASAAIVDSSAMFSAVIRRRLAKSRVAS